MHMFYMKIDAFIHEVYMHVDEVSDPLDRRLKEAFVNILKCLKI